MGNLHRGEVEATGLDGTVYVFKLGTNAICTLEETLNKPVLALFEELQQGKIRLTTVREFVKASAVDKTDLTDAEAGERIDNIGVMPVLAVMTESILVTFNAKEGAVDPPTPARKGRRAGAGNLNRPQK